MPADRRSSTRRTSAQGTASHRRRPATKPETDRQSRRSQPASRTTEPEPPTARMSKSERAEAREVGAARARQRARPASSRRQLSADEDAGGRSPVTIILVVAVVVIIAAGASFAVVWPGIQREMVLTELDQAEGPTAISLADDYLDLVRREPEHVRSALAEQRGPVVARVHLAQELELLTQVVQLAFDPNLSADDRAAALAAASELLDDGISNAARVDEQQLVEWVVQADQPSPHADLATAAAGLLAAHDADACTRLLTQTLQQQTNLQPAAVNAAATALAEVVNTDSVPLVIQLLTSPHSPLLRAHSDLMAASSTAVRAHNLDSVFALLDHSDPEVKTAAITLLSGNGIRNATTDDREAVGQRLGAYLTAATRTETPAVFSQAVIAVREVRLVGALDALLSVLPTVEPDHPDAAVLTDILGQVFVRDGSDEDQDLAERTVEGLAAAMLNPGSQAVAAAALQRLRVKDLVASRMALEACAEVGADSEAAMAALKHIVSDLYQRDNLIRDLGDDVQGWRDFLAADGPRFAAFQEIKPLVIKYSDIRATDDPKRVSTAWSLVLEHTHRLVEWKEGNQAQLPLGITEPMVDEALNRLGTLRYSIQKAKL